MADLGGKMMKKPGRGIRLPISLFFPTSLLACALVVIAACNGFLCISTEATDSYSQRTALSHSRVTLMAAKEEISPLVQVRASMHRRKGRKRRSLYSFLNASERSKRFASRAKDFFFSSGNSSCESRFFMTWISPLDLFGDRELFVIESLFKSNPEACLLILSDTLDSTGGVALLGPIQDKGFRVSAMAPDYSFLFKNTAAALWLKRLVNGKVNPGEIALGQNLSNLLRHAVLYKFGGVYLDADVVVLKSFSDLKNTIGAQAVDLATGNWSRLNNAVMIFDKGHPLLFKFIQEFSLTFDGNKWGHNGPYLVSRVSARVKDREGYNFTVLPPSAFYLLDWRRIESLFKAPKSEEDRRWISENLRKIRRSSFALHLWNRHSRNIEIEDGSVISLLMDDFCILCNQTIPYSV